MNFPMEVHGAQEFRWGPLVIAGEEITTRVSVKEIYEHCGRGSSTSSRLSRSTSAARLSAPAHGQTSPGPPDDQPHLRRAPAPPSLPAKRHSTAASDLSRAATPATRSTATASTGSALTEGRHLRDRYVRRVDVLEDSLAVVAHVGASLEHVDPS
jgi:hypothetical protein